MMISAKSRFVPLCVYLSFCFGIAFSVNSHAADYWSGRTAALSGAGHAAPLLTDAIYMNPSMASFINGYTGSISYSSFSGPNDNEPKGRIRHISVIDSMNPEVQSGFGFTQNSLGKQYHGILSKKFAQGSPMAIGAGIKHLGGSGSKASITNFSMGGIISPLPWATIGLLVDNIKENDTSLQWSAYRTYTLGLKANLQKIVMIYVDPSHSPTRNKSTGYSAGIEIPFFTDGFIRVGRSKDIFQPHLGVHGSGVGFGAGFIFPKFGIDFGHYKTNSPTRSEGSVLSLSATF